MIHFTYTHIYVNMSFNSIGGFHKTALGGGFACQWGENYDRFDRDRVQEYVNK